MPFEKSDGIRLESNYEARIPAVASAKHRGPPPPLWIWLTLPLGWFAQSTALGTALYDLIQTHSLHLAHYQADALLGFRLYGIAVIPIAITAAFTLTLNLNVLTGIPCAMMCALALIVSALAKEGSLVVAFVGLGGVLLFLLNMSSIQDFLWPSTASRLPGWVL